MIDLSDGLSTDLARICDASHVGARIVARQLPTVSVSAAAAKLLRGKRFDPIGAALHDGDDYQLLFTVSPRISAKLRRAHGAREINAIGEITRQRNIVVLDDAGSSSPLASRGWDSFR
jgi:thiamine-monophosphate kinase